MPSLTFATVLLILTLALLVPRAVIAHDLELRFHKLTALRAVLDALETAEPAVFLCEPSCVGKLVQLVASHLTLAGAVSRVTDLCGLEQRTLGTDEQGRTVIAIGGREYVARQSLPRPKVDYAQIIRRREIDQATKLNAIAAGVRERQVARAIVDRQRSAKIWSAEELIRERNKSKTPYGPPAPSFRSSRGRTTSQSGSSANCQCFPHCRRRWNSNQCHANHPGGGSCYGGAPGAPCQ